MTEPKDCMGFDTRRVTAELTDINERGRMSMPWCGRAPGHERWRNPLCKLAVIRVCALAAAIMLSASAAPAQSPAASFAGKHIGLLIGLSPTAYGYDTQLARNLGKYLPGNPLIVPENRRGAGSLSLASYMTHAAQRYVSEIAIVNHSVAMEPILDAPHVIARAQAIAAAN